MTSPMPTTTVEGDKPMTYWQHGWEKCKANPAVPIGCAATTVALLGASASLRSGNRKQFQNFLRLRVATQGITVIAMVAGAYMLTNKAAEVEETRKRARNGGAPAPEKPTYEVQLEPSTDHLYPPRDKVKVSDFTKRLRDAEEQQRAEDAAKNGQLIDNAKNINN